MSHQLTKTPQQLTKSRSNTAKNLATFASILFVGSSLMLQLNGYITWSVSMFLMGLSGVFGYWSSPATVSFPRFAFRYFFYMSSVFLALWYLPKELVTRMPPFYAFSLPALLIGITLYWVPPHVPRKKPALWIWVLGCVATALFFGWIGTRFSGSFD